MLALRFVAGLAIAIWIGGACAIGGVVAPAAFAALPAPDAATLVGEVLRRFHLVTYAAGFVLAAALLVMAVLGPRPRAFGLRIAVVALMLATTLLSGLWVDRRIADVRRAVGAPIGSLAPGDERRVAFGRLHALSTALMGLGALGGLVLLFLDSRDAR